MDKCPICLDDLDESSPALPCGHRCHADCLGQLSEATGSAPTRRGLVIACPSCRQKSRVAAQTPVAAFDVGDEVYALWGHRWYPGVVDDVLEDGYEIAWDEEDASNEVPAGRVRARVQPVPAAVATPRDTPEPQVAPARPPSRSLRRDPRCPCGPPPSRSLRDRRCLRRPLRTRMEPKAPAPAKKMRSEAGRERQRAHSKKWKREERERERAREAKKQKRFEELRENYPKQRQRAADDDADDAPAHTPAPAAETSVAPPRRSGRAPAPKVIFDAPDERDPSQKRRAKRPEKQKQKYRKHIEGANQKANGKWTCQHFPGREFDDLDAYRAAKKQRGITY